MPVTRLGKHARLACIAVVLATTTGATAGEGGSDFPMLLGGLALILVAAKLAGWALGRLKLPSVLGELLVGVVIGNLKLTGWHGLDFISTHTVIAALAELGVILLLFEVGLETAVGEMAKVGRTAFAVAVVGVLVPLGLGYGVAAFELPAATWHTHLFVGAILTATSVGITARVLKDMGAIASLEGRIILGAAVIDDVLGLVVLAVVKGVIAGAASGHGVGAVDVLIIVGKAVGFFAAAILVGGRLSHVVFRFADRLHIPGVLLAFALAMCFGGALLAHLVGLAPIVGAFAVGMILDRVQYKSVEEVEGHGLEDLVRPITAMLVPVFFVVTGAHVDVSQLGDRSALGFAALLTVAAIVGKLGCGLVVGGGVRRLAIGVGMIPRGEVGLIFAAVGATTLMPDGSAVVDPRTYAAVVIMIMITTLVTPPLLTRLLRK